MSDDYHLINAPDHGMPGQALKRVIQIDADVAINEFNYVEGHVYLNEAYGTYTVPAHTSAGNYVVDCWQIEREDWEAGMRPADLEAQGNVPTPVRVSELGVPHGWLEDMLAPSHAKRLKP